MWKTEYNEGVRETLWRSSRRARLPRKKESSLSWFRCRAQRTKNKESSRRRPPPHSFEGVIFLKFIFLSDSFYKAYIQCSEIEQKRDRPYIQACVQMGGRLFAVPMRSHIKHKYVLWTDKENNCGLDFSKAVVLKRQEYIDDTRQPYVRPNEFESYEEKITL